MIMNTRIVNCRFVCCGLHFDAAIDYDWEMHCYDQTEQEKRDTTPIELYCLDKPEWDIRMMFHKERNDQQGANRSLYFSCVDIDAIKKEARRWVREMRKK